MKSASVLSILFSFLLPLLGFQTQAEAKTTVGSICEFDFVAKGTDIQIIAGYSKLKGEGRITCVDQTTSKRDVLPFKITIGTPLIFFRISFAPSLVVRGGARGIEILKGGPQILLGEYLTLDVRGAIGTAGFAKFLTLEGQDNGLSIDLGLENIEGFGIALGGTFVTLE